MRTPGDQTAVMLYADRLAAASSVTFTLEPGIYAPRRQLPRRSRRRQLRQSRCVICFVVVEPHSRLWEVVRSHFEAFNRGDIERCLDFWREDRELVVSEALPEPGRSLGRDAAAAWFDNYFRSFEPGYAFRMEEIIEVAGDVVVIAAHHGIARRSGVEISGESAYLYGVGGEKIARVALYRDRREALEAAGVRE